MPSAETVTGDEQAVTPEPSSAHVNDTATGALYQPAAFGARSADALIVGATVSMRTCTVACATFPARSETAPVTPCVPSALTTTGSWHCATPDSWSSQTKVTVAGVRLHPAGAVALIVGAVVSRLTVMLVLAVFPARSVTVPVMA
jgi:hypothetical protein